MHAGVVVHHVGPVRVVAEVVVVVGGTAVVEESAMRRASAAAAAGRRRSATNRVGGVGGVRVGGFRFVGLRFRFGGFSSSHDDGAHDALAAGSALAGDARGMVVVVAVLGLGDGVVVVRGLFLGVVDGGGGGRRRVARGGGGARALASGCVLDAESLDGASRALDGGVRDRERAPGGVLGRARVPREGREHLSLAPPAMSRRGGNRRVVGRVAQRRRSARARRHRPDRVDDGRPRERTLGDHLALGDDVEALRAQRRTRRGRGVRRHRPGAPLASVRARVGRDDLNARGVAAGRLSLGGAGPALGS